MKTLVFVPIVVVTVIAAGGVFSPVRASADRAAVGRWSEPFWEGGRAEYDPPSLENSKKFPTAVQATLLPDGRLLYWNGFEGSENSTWLIFDEQGNVMLENSRARILDLGGDTPQWSIPRFERGSTKEARDRSHSADDDLFCADQKLLYDGRVLIVGGSKWPAAAEADPSLDLWGDVRARLFDPATDTFRTGARMQEDRWYPSLVTLSDGNLAAISGVRRVVGSFLNPEPSFSQVRRTEIYDPAADRWADGGEGQWSLPLLARLHLLPDGTVFYGGAGEFWTPLGETADQATWALQRVYDPEEKTWSIVGENLYGGRSGAASAMLRLEPPYDKADILLIGGTVGPPPGTWLATTVSQVVRWTPEGVENDPVKSPFAGLSGDATQLRNRRWMGNSVMLPTGEVFLVNGADGDDVVDPGSGAAVRAAELYDPDSGTWREVAEMSRDRTYHASAVLLPDGRVLVGGHAPLPAHYFRHDHPVTRNSNYRDSTFEIYEPPYLFRGPRPVVSSVVPARNGRSLELRLGKKTRADDISEVVLVRLSANTHALDSDMRAVKLEHEVRGGKVVAELPRDGDGGILPPGPYYVFAMRDSKDGPVPSIAKVVLIKPTGGGKVAARARDFADGGRRK